MRHSVLLSAVAVLLAACRNSDAQEASPADMNRTLYNGIVLPTSWPPSVEKLTREPMSPQYLKSPPPVIPIGVGRQLFVDDFLIEQTTLGRTWHQAEYHPKNPVLKPDKPWEVTPPSPTAMVFSDGVFYDPADKLFKMWYMGGYVKATCLATSKDGVAWDKPALDVKPGTNMVHEGHRDSATVWLDLDEKDPARRYKLFVTQLAGEGPRKNWAVHVHVSPDGIHWGKPAAVSTPVGDRTTVFYNPFRKVWVYSIRCGAAGLGRSRRYRECADPVAGATWKPQDAPLWIGADRRDPPRDDLFADRTTPELYNLDAVAYESLMLGLFTIWPGQPKDRAKPNYVCLGFSRDGFGWTREDFRPFVGVSEKYGDWNWGNVQSAGGGCLIVGDKLYFYVSARAGVRGSGTSGVCSTGLAALRRDGFCSMDAESAGVLTTRPVTFRGKHLYVNVAAPEGSLRVTILDAEGKAIAPFVCQGGVPVRGDTTCARVAWKGGDDLSALAGKPVRFRFHLEKGQLYAFWVSPEESGASHGYVAAGGPGFTGPTDTVGTPR